jgi:iron complex outermembrane receptor protein
MRIIFLFVLTLVSMDLWAENPPLEHVLVSVPLHKKTAETALPVTVISGEDLRRMAAATIGETLAMTPGLANASFGPGVGQPVIRGQQGPRVTMLQNGTSSADASSLSADHAVSVEAVLADSVEILRGPATLLYGGGAIGGVINVLDNRIPTTLETGYSGALEIRHESASDMTSVVPRLDGGVGKLAWHVDGLYRDYNDLNIPGFAASGEERRESDRHLLENTNGRAQSLTLGASYHFENGYLGLSFNDLASEYGIPGGGHPHEDHDAEQSDDHNDEEAGIRLDIEQTRVDAVLHWHEPTSGVEVIRGFLTHTDYQHKEIEGSGEVGTIYSNTTIESRVEVVHEPLLGLHGVFGLQFKAGEFSALGEEAFIPVTDNTDIGIFLLEDFHHNNLTFEAGLRLDRVERKPTSVNVRAQHFHAFSASGSILWDLQPNWQFGLAVSQARRAPTTEELFSNVGLTSSSEWIVHAATNAIELGNAKLDVEISNNVDASLRWHQGDHWVDLTAFYNDFSDYINLQSTGEMVDDIPVRRYQQEDAVFRGIELDSEFALGTLAGGQLMGGLFADLVRGELDVSGDVPRLPPHRVGLRLNWSSDDLHLWARVSKAGRQDRPGVNETTTSGYLRYDLGLEYSRRTGAAEVVWFASAENIGNKDIRSSTSFLREVAPESGRSIKAGVRLLF